MILTPFRRHSGFTLLELLIAVSLMAVLAVLSWRSLDTVLKSREQLTKAGDELQALTIFFAQLDEDLKRSWPTRLLEPEVPNIAMREEVPGGPLAYLQVLREGGGALDPVRIERVAYRLSNGVVERGFASYVKGAAADATAFRWQPLISNVTSLQFRGYVEGAGWIASAVSGLAADKRVTGVELALERRAAEDQASLARRYLRVFSVKD